MSTTADIQPGLAGIRPRAEKLPVMAALYLLAVTLPLMMQVGPLMMTSLRLLLIIIVVPLTIQLFIGKYGRLYATDFLFLLHIAWATVALAVNNPSQVVEQIGSVGMEFLGGYVVGRAYIRDRESFVALCKLLALIVCGFLPFALVETITGRPVVLEAIRSLPGIRTVGFNTQEQRLGLERVQMTFAHPIHWGLFCAVTFSLSFVALKDYSSVAWRLISSAIIGFSGFLALSSGALLALILQLGLIGWAIVFARVKARWWILFGLFVIAYIVVDLLSNRTPIRVFMSYATFSAHTAYWRSIIFDWGVDNVLGNAERGIPGSPLFGIGLNDWIRPDYMNSGSMDNFWLVMAVRYGIPGFATVTLGYILVLYHIMRRNFDSDPALANIRRGWVFTFMGLSFTLCTVHVWTNIYSFVFFMFGAGIWLIAAQPEEEGASGGGTKAPSTKDSTDTGPNRSSLPFARTPPAPATMRQTLQQGKTKYASTPSYTRTSRAKIGPRS